MEPEAEHLVKRCGNRKQQHEARLLECNLMIRVPALYCQHVDFKDHPCLEELDQVEKDLSILGQHDL